MCMAACLAMFRHILARAVPDESLRPERSQIYCAKPEDYAHRSAFQRLKTESYLLLRLFVDAHEREPSS
jgi:hypothetical protein